MRKTDDETILRMLKENHTQKEIAEHFGVSPAAICKRVKRLEVYPKTLKELTPKEQRFAVSVAQGMSQTKAAIDSYETSSMASAKSLGSQLMKKPKIDAAISELMEYHGIGRSKRVQVLGKHVFNRDPNVSLKALDQSWKIDGSYRETHLHVGMTREDVEELQESISEAKERRAEAQQEINEARARRKELEAMLAEMEAKESGIADNDD
jgi:phage terminase small subunit